MYQLSQMNKEDIPQVMELWRDPYSRYCNRAALPAFLSGGADSMAAYLEKQIRQGNAILAKDGDALAGYMAWMYMDFHHERSAFCPITGHAAVGENRRAICHALYTCAAQKWVADGRFNHLWMIYNEDHALKDMLYDIGFGSHVVDAYTKVPAPVRQTGSKFKISAATHKDAAALLPLVNESVRFYMGSPLFLKRSVYKLEDIIDMTETGHLLVAWDRDTPIGIMYLSVQAGYNIENLASPRTGLINKAGAYIMPAYRGMGIGKRLLHEVMKYCAEENVPCLHVCFETANPFANVFWRKHFQPIILSVRRTVNKDANLGDAHKGGSPIWAP